MIPEQFRLKNTIKYPTSLIIGGLTRLGLEIAESLLEQGGYVIIVDTYTDKNIKKLDSFPAKSLISFIDFSSIPDLDDELRRLDYVFFFAHESLDLGNKVSTQEFLKFSNYLDTTLSVTSKFEAKFLLTTSIKANQLVFAKEDIDLSQASTDIRHKIYTEMEIQRYAESLVMEYVEKTNLDARITRLGEIIGEGVDFTVSSAFNDLILEATTQDMITLKKDGLESDWYVHLLDAAYGIIKAQFSKSTMGKIYSVCYENAYTHLSVAYKIQEAEEGNKEIKFVDSKDNLPSIKIYKPAPNLSIIGWMPRITFDKAVKQSLAAAKIFMIEKRSDDSSSPKGGKKLQNFLALASSSSLASTNGDHVSKLIEERKQSEQLKKERLEIAHSEMARKRRFRPKTRVEKFRRWMWEITLSLGRSFSFLKYKTPFELGVLLVLGILFVIIYINFLSPLLALTRNLLVAVPEFDKLEEQVALKDYSGMQKSAQKAKESFNKSASILEDFRGFSQLLAIDDSLDQIITAFNNYSLFANGVENVSLGYSSFYGYTDSFKNNTQVRTSGDTYLSTLDTGLNLNSELSSMQENSAYVELGMNKMEQAQANISAYRSDALPSFITKQINKANLKILEIQDYQKFLAAANYIPEVLGKDGSKTYLILLLDNSRLTPAGGEIAAFALVKIDNGSISDVVLKPVDDVNFNLNSIDKITLDEINTRRFTYLTPSSVTVNGITSIRDFSEFSQVAENIWEDTFDTNIDGVLSINLIALDDMIKLIPQEKLIEVNGVVFNQGDILTNLNNTQTTNQNLKERHRVITKLFSQVFFDLLDDINGNPSLLIALLEARNETGDIAFSTDTLRFREYVRKNSLDLANASDGEYFTEVSINVEDPSLVNVGSFANIDYSVTTDMNYESKVKQNIIINSTPLGLTQEVSVCLPYSIIGSSVEVLDNFPKERYAINSRENTTCIVFKVTTENTIKMSWEIYKPEENDFTIGISEVRGGQTTKIDYILNTPTGYALENTNTFVNTSNNAYLMSTSPGSDTILKLNLISD